MWAGVSMLTCVQPFVRGDEGLSLHILGHLDRSPGKSLCEKPFLPLCFSIRASDLFKEKERKMSNTQSLRAAFACNTQSSFSLFDYTSGFRIENKIL